MAFFFIFSLALTY